jgi:hypothetical protein
MPESSRCGNAASPEAPPCAITPADDLHLPPTTSNKLPLPLPTDHGTIGGEGTGWPNRTSRSSEPSR